jgi:hypothetical protein
MYPYVLGLAAFAIWICFSSPNVLLYQQLSGRVPAGMQLVVTLASGPIGSVIMVFMGFYRSVTDKRGIRPKS